MRRVSRDGILSEEINVLIVGYDPGGKDANGAAILRVSREGNASASLCACDSIDNALQWVLSEIGECVVDAAGIDSFLSWSTGPAGWRCVDKALKRKYSQVAKSVLASNSASGSMAVQGMAFAIRLRSRFPRIILNETHPKVAYYALTEPKRKHNFKGERNEMIEWLKRKFTPPLDVKVKNDHEWDALFSCWATWMGVEGGWRNDLAALEQNLLMPAGKVTYFWPEQIGEDGLT